MAGEPHGRARSPQKRSRTRWEAQVISPLWRSRVTEACKLANSKKETRDGVGLLSRQAEAQNTFCALAIRTETAETSL